MQGCAQGWEFPLHQGPASLTRSCALSSAHAQVHTPPGVEGAVHRESERWLAVSEKGYAENPGGEAWGAPVSLEVKRKGPAEMRVLGPRRSLGKSYGQGEQQVQRPRGQTTCQSS